MQTKGLNESHSSVVITLECFFPFYICIEKIQFSKTLPSIESSRNDTSRDYTLGKSGFKTWGKKDGTVINK